MFSFYFDYDIYHESSIAYHDTTDVLVYGHASYSRKDIEYLMRENHRKFLDDITIFKEKYIIFEPINRYLLPYDDKKLMKNFYSEYKDFLNMSKEEFNLLIELKGG